MSLVGNFVYVELCLYIREKPRATYCEAQTSSLMRRGPDWPGEDQV